MPVSQTVSPALSRISSSASFTQFGAGMVPIRPPTAPEPEVSIKVQGLGRDIKLAVDAAPGCGGIAWPAGEVLSNYLAYRHGRAPDMLKNKKIVELGSGTGLVGLAVGLLEASSETWITDQDVLLPLMRENVRLNFVDNPDPPVKVCELDWGTDLCSELPENPDIILAADCVYFEPAFPLLVETLCALCPIGQPREVLFCWKKRRKADQRFFKMMHKHFDSTPVEDDRPGERERYEREGVKLLKLVRTK